MTFQPRPLPTSVPTAADLATTKARTADGAVVATTGRRTPGDNGAAAYISRRSGRSGQTIDQGAFIAGPGVDDYWEVTRKDVLRLSIYPIDNTGIVDDGYLPLADQVEGETLVVDEGTYLIQTDYTLTRRVHFENGAKFKIANGFTLTLSNGYVATDTQHVFDISDGGVVVVDNMAGVSVAHWGAVPDTSVNSSPMIQAAFDANEGIAATATYYEPKRPEVFVPPGSYRLNTGVVLKNKSNLYAAGATFIYYGSQASNGAILTIGQFTIPGEEIELGTFFLPSVMGLPTSPFQVPVANEEFAAIRIDCCGSSVFHCELTNFTAIGLQLKPNTKSYVAHNHFLNHKSWAYKYALDIEFRWDQDEAGNLGWSNENVFTNCNATQDGSTRYVGTTACCRMRCTNTRPDTGWDFGGSNNNRFFGQCYQPQLELAGARITVGLVAVQNSRYFNHVNRQEYICTVGGTVATIPTQTDYSQSAADANGVRFTHTGFYGHISILLDKSGGYNLWHGTRCEYGDGPVMMIANSDQDAANLSIGNELVLYDYPKQNSYEGGRILIDDYTLSRSNSFVGMHNTARVYGQDLNHKHVINDMHKRFIASASGLTFRGMVFYNPSPKTISDYANYGLDDWKLFKNAVSQTSYQHPGVVVDLSDAKRIGSHFKTAVNPSSGISGANVVVPLDDNDEVVAVASTSTKDCVSNGAWNATNLWQITDGPIYFSIGTNEAITKVFCGVAGAPAAYTSHLELTTVPGTIDTAMLAVTTPDNGRFSVGVPTGGFFLEPMEFIRNYTTEAFSPSGWRVKQTGILAQPWEDGVAVLETELRVSDTNKVYAALSSGTTGATPPTGTGSSFDDDNILWEYIGTTAVLEEVYEGEALAVGNPPITGNLTLNSDGTSVSYYRANTYVSEKVLSGDFDITFQVTDTSGQSHMVGVTALTAPTDVNNYQNFAFGVQWYSALVVQISQLAVQKTHTIAGWGNRYVRLVRTGTTIDLYINDVLIALETAVFTANAGTNVLTSAGHGLADGRPVRFEGADLADGIVQGTVYYVRDSTTDTFKIAATLGGAAVDLLDAGSGTQTFYANAIPSVDMRAMYSAYDEPNSHATILDDDYKPTNLGGALIAEIEDFEDVAAETVTFSATAVFNFATGRSKHKKIILTANATGLVVIAPIAGVYHFLITQDGTGGYTAAFATTITGTAPTLASGANASTLHTVYSNGAALFWM